MNDNLSKLHTTPVAIQSKINLIDGTTNASNIVPTNIPSTINKPIPLSTTITTATSSEVNTAVSTPSNKEKDSDEASRLKASKKMACVECRQQKSKCDAQDRHPEPCTRCLKKKVPCSLQSDYKRTYKRAKFQRIEEELQQLKKNLSENGADLLQQLKEGKLSEIISQSPATAGQLLQQNLQNLNDTHPQRVQIPLLRDGSSVSSPAFQTVPYFNNPAITGNQPAFKNEPSIIQENTGRLIIPDIVKEKQPEVYEVPEEALLCQPKQFGEVELCSEQIKELFMVFVNRYHRFLPILDVKKGPERIYRYSPILFWTIISIALRQISTTTLMQLAPLLKKAFAEISISPITRYLPDESDEPILNVSSVFSVQAFLLYTFWPPLTSSLSADSSWNTVGIAIFQAIRLGLNGPGMNNYNHHESSKILSEHVRTWISCNIVSQTIATAFGFPAFNSFDSAVIGSTRTNNDIPLSLKHMVQISHFEDQIAKVLNSNTSDPNGLVDPAERLPLLKVLYKQFVELEIKLESEGMDDVRKFQLLSTKVHLLTYYFLDNSRIANFELRYGLVSLYNAALNLLTHLGTMTDKDPFFLKHCPVVFIVKIWQAACIVAKLVHSAISDVIDVGTGRQVYTVAIQSAMKASILKHDIAYRSSGLMRNMWQLFKALREQSNISNLTVTVKTRMSASLFFDCLWVLREQVGMIKLGMNDTQDASGLKNAHEANSVSASDDDEVFSDGANDVDGDNNVEALDEEASGSTKDHPTTNSETSAQSGKRRPRSLSNNFNAENAARKIIKTIPLDPSPITIKADQRLSSTSPHSNTSTPGSGITSSMKSLQSSLRDVIQRQNTPDRVIPVISHERGSHNISNSNSNNSSTINFGNSNASVTATAHHSQTQSPQMHYSDYQVPPPQQRSLFTHHHQFQQQSQQNSPQLRQQSLPTHAHMSQHHQANQSQQQHQMNHESQNQQQANNQYQQQRSPFPNLTEALPTNYVSPTNIASLDFNGEEWDTDIWKEVGSVMNDFGFNADS